MHISEAQSTSKPRREAEPQQVLLYAEHFAPWCEKARWALDHHSIAYRYREHVPLMGECTLRRVSGRYGGPVSVPLLVVNGEVIMDSYRIALKADEIGAGALLFPLEHADAIQSWNERSEALMQSGRALLLERLAVMPDALAEQVPGHVPAGLRRLLAPAARAGVRFVARKYSTAARLPTAEEALAEVLRQLRKAVCRHSCLVGGAFSFADVAMATSLQFVEPVSNRYMRLGPATRRAWSNERFRHDYRDLLAWRDMVYEQHRRRAAPAVAGPVPGG